MNNTLFFELKYILVKNVLKKKTKSVIHVVLK